MNYIFYNRRSLFTRSFIYVILIFFFINIFINATVLATSNNMLHAQKFTVQILPEYQKPTDWEQHLPHVMVSITGMVFNEDSTEYQELLSIKLPVDEQNFMMDSVYEIDRAKHQIDWKIEGEYVYWTPSVPIKSGEVYEFSVEFHYSPVKLIDNVMVLEYNYCFCFPIDVLELNLYMPTHTDQHDVFPAQHTKNVINNGVNVYSYYFEKVGTNQSLELVVKYIDYGIQNVFYGREGFTNYYETVDYDFMAIIIFTLMLVVIGLFVMSLTGNKNTTISSINDIANTTEDYLSDEERERRRELRKLLIDGKINEDTYRELL